MENFSITKRIKEICDKKGISYYKLSQISGIPNTTLTNMLNRGTTPTFCTLEKICRALNITMAQFFGGDSDMTGKQKEFFDIYIMLSDTNQDLLMTIVKALDK